MWGPRDLSWDSVVWNGNVWCALFGVYYCPPSTGGDYLEALSESLSVVSQQGIGTVMLLGYSWNRLRCVPSMTSPAVSHHPCKIIQEHSLEQMMRMPTRCDALLDLMLTNSPHSVSDLISGPGLSISDHNTVEFTVSCQQHHKVQHAKVVHNYNQADFVMHLERLLVELPGRLYFSVMTTLT